MWTNAAGTEARLWDTRKPLWIVPDDDVLAPLNTQAERMDMNAATQDALLERAEWAAAKGAFKEAKTAFDKVLETDPSNETALYGRVVALRGLEQLPEAEEALVEAQRRVAETPRGLTERGLLFYDRADYERAVVAFDEALVAEPDDDTALRFRASSLRMLGRLDEAEEALPRLSRRAVRRRGC